MVDAADAIGKAREAVSDRAELPGMSLMEHLDELRRRIVHSARLSLRWLHRCLGSSMKALRLRPGAAGSQSANQAQLHPSHGSAEPVPARSALLGGAIIASPFILYQVWLFIAPGLYQKRKRFVVPFMAATVGLFLAGACFGYFYVLPGALKILIVDFGHNFNSDDHHRGLHRLLPVGDSRPRHQFRDADPDLLPGDVWHREPEISLEEHPLRDSRRVYRCGHHLPEPRPLDDVHLRDPDARALHDRHRRGVVGASLAPEEPKRRAVALEFDLRFRYRVPQAVSIPETWDLVRA